MPLLSSCLVQVSCYTETNFYYESCMLREWYTIALSRVVVYLSTVSGGRRGYYFYRWSYMWLTYKTKANCRYYSSFKIELVSNGHDLNAIIIHPPVLIESGRGEQITCVRIIIQTTLIKKVKCKLVYYLCRTLQWALFLIIANWGCPSW